jgi:hypothetical protein
VTDFTREEPWSLDWVADEDRRTRLRQIYPARGVWFDGREH